MSAVVPLSPQAGAPGLGERVRELQAQARSLARSHILDLIHKTAIAANAAQDVAAGGEAYPPGVRELARRMAADLEAQAQTLHAILERTDR